MAYTALYRKWRPQRFEEVQGQEAVVQTLRNQIQAERIGHAYLFCGTRGTGKTTIAKLFARAVNCEHPINGSPCNECSACQAILSGASMNVVEIDAASNNGVDNIREIREEVRYSPTEGRYRVYIIDEVHMLSTGAYNALLKTLEEPPSYVIFILATTEVHKIPVTVLSRCQRYDFKRIAAGTIYEHLCRLAKAENIDAEEKALRYIARAADGAMRDALSILEQCISYYYGQTLTYDNVLEVIGAVDTAVFSGLLQNILERDVTGAMKLIEDMVFSGRDLGQLVSDFIWFLRNLLLIQTSEVSEEELGMSSENFRQHKQMAMCIDMEELMRYIHVFSTLQNQMRYASEKRTLLEVAVIRAMKPAMETDLEGVLSRLRDLESRMENGGFVSMQSSSQTGENVPDKQVRSASIPAPLEEQVQIVTLPAATYEDLEQIKKRWHEIGVAAGGAVPGYLGGTWVTFQEGRGFTIVFQNVFNFRIVNRQEWLDILDKAAQTVLNKEIHFSAALEEQVNPNVRFQKEAANDSRIQGIGIEIGEEE